MSTVSASGRKPRKERKDNADKRRRQILDAAFKSIATHGLAKTTLATVAREAGLSQGVAVFYFESKNGILTAVLRDLYQTYEAHWQAALDQAGGTPAEQLRAIITADFDARICNPSMLSAWFAFWGEQNFVPQYAEVTGEYESRRADAVGAICAELSSGGSGKASLAGDWIDTLTDGYWEKLHLFPEQYTRETALARTMEFAQVLFPAHAGAFEAALCSGKS